MYQQADDVICTKCHLCHVEKRHVEDFMRNLVFVSFKSDLIDLES
jgi:hypothetical protein